MLYGIQGAIENIPDKYLSEDTKEKLKRFYKALQLSYVEVVVMSNIQDLINGLTDHDDKKAYECLRKLEERSCQSSIVYPFFDTFVEMLDSDNSYVRTRAFLLITANAKWDIDNRIDEIIQRFLECSTDDKPTTARQCIKVLPTIAKYKPHLKRDIENSLRHINLSKYKESMQTLIIKDIQKVLETMNTMSKLKA